jgi:hypothetical protein
MPLHACTCEIGRESDALAAETERLGIALSAVVARFADIVNLLNPRMGSYDTNPATIVQVVAICESVIASVATEDLR